MFYNSNSVRLLGVAIVEMAKPQVKRKGYFLRPLCALRGVH
jgi:hypothetical protein